MAKEYNERLESEYVNLRNFGTPYGGAITAALVLQNFVSDKQPFAHIDICGSCLVGQDWSYRIWSQASDGLGATTRTSYSLLLLLVGGGGLDRVLRPR